MTATPGGVGGVLDAGKFWKRDTDTHCNRVPSVTPACTSTHLVVSPFGWIARPVTVGADDEVELGAELEVDDGAELEVDDGAEEVVEVGPELSALIKSAARSALESASSRCAASLFGRDLPFRKGQTSDATRPAWGESSRQPLADRSRRTIRQLLFVVRYDRTYNPVPRVDRSSKVLTHHSGRADRMPVAPVVVLDPGRPAV